MSYPIVADTVRQYSAALWVMMGAVGFVLLIACANVANLTWPAPPGGRKRLLCGQRWARVVGALSASCWSKA